MSLQKKAIICDVIHLILFNDLLLLFFLCGSWAKGYMNVRMCNDIPSAK